MTVAGTEIWYRPDTMTFFSLRQLSLTSADCTVLQQQREAMSPSKRKSGARWQIDCIRPHPSLGKCDLYSLEFLPTLDIGLPSATIMPLHASAFYSFKNAKLTK